MTYFITGDTTNKKKKVPSVIHHASEQRSLNNVYGAPF